MEFVKIDNTSKAYDPEIKTNGKIQKAAKFLIDWSEK